MPQPPWPEPISESMPEYCRVGYSSTLARAHFIVIHPHCCCSLLLLCFAVPSAEPPLHCCALSKDSGVFWV